MKRVRKPTKSRVTTPKEQGAGQMPEPRQILPGSARDAAAGARLIGKTDGTSQISVTVVLKRKRDIQPADLHRHALLVPDGRPIVDHAAFADQYGASNDAVDAIRAFAASHGLSVTNVDQLRRVITLSGSVANMEQTFGTLLHDYAIGGKTSDPDTGINVRANGNDSVSGGTSAVAPQWVALTAVISQVLKKKAGFFIPLLYANSKVAATNDIVAGNNSVFGVTGFLAKPGWDACTGLGSANGAKLLALLSSAGAPVVEEAPPSSIGAQPDAETAVVCTENSNSDIMVMQSAKDRVGMDTASSLNWARERRVLI
jgi:hypothetical protein